MQWNSPKSATYDVGQIVYDYYDLSKYDLNYAYCIALVHGAISSIPEATAKGVARSFHNALFTDFQSAREWGDMKFSRLELRTYRDMGLDKPYCERAANPNNFCRLYRREKLAVVGICVNRLD